MSTTIAEHRVESATPGDLRVRLLRDLSGFRAMKNAWNELASQCAAASVFQTWEWTDAWLRAYGDRELMIIVGGDDAGVAGILPLYVSRWPKPSARSLKVLRFLSDDPDDAGGLGVIARRGKQHAFADAALGWLMENRSEWDALELNLLAAEGPEPLMAALRNHKLINKVRSVPRSVLALPLRMQAIAEKPIAISRKNLAKLAQRRIDIRRCETKDEAEETIEQLFRLHAARWKAKQMPGAFATPNRKKFYRILTNAMFETERLDMWSFRIDGDTVAAEFGLVFNDVRYSMQAGFDPAYQRFHVGTILDRKIIEAAVGRNIQSFDFGPGDERYKRDWGATQENFYFVRCAPTGSVGALWAQASGVKILQKAWVAMKKGRAADSQD